MARGHRTAPCAARGRQPVAGRGAVRPRRRRLRPPHVPVRPVGVGEELLARRGARAVAARDRPAHRDPRPQLGLRAPAEARERTETQLAQRWAGARRRDPRAVGSVRGRRAVAAAIRRARSSEPGRAAAARPGRRPRGVRRARRGARRPAAGEPRRACGTPTAPDARRLRLRVRNLGVEDWGVWARQDGGSVLGALDDPEVRCLVVDLGSLATREEQALVAEAVLARPLGPPAASVGRCSPSSTRRTTCARRSRATL